MGLLRALFTRKAPTNHDERDKALLVSLLAARGEEDMLGIRLYMKDHTRGEHDWMWRGERGIYRLLDRLESEGVVTSYQPPTGQRQYRLVAPPERLVAVR